MFIVIQFCAFIKGFFALYRSSLENDVLRSMAYHDMLTNVANRNAYEEKLKELSARGNLNKLCCLIVDINDLKLINDNYGHAAGDTAIVETSRIMCENLPSNAFLFRTGGDEFVILLEEYDNKSIHALAEKITFEAELCGDQHSFPLSIAVGEGCFGPEDNDLLDFIRRVDADMYGKKRTIKSNIAYTFRRQSAY